MNSTNSPLREIWRNKLITVILHSIFYYNSAFESHRAGIEILSELPDWLTQKVVDDVWHWDSWEISGRCPGSKRIKIRFGHLPQDSIDNEALCCMDWLLDHYDEYGYIIRESKLLKDMWDFAQESEGECLYPDEVLTYKLERKLSDDPGSWVAACRDVFTNGIPSDKYKKYWFSKKIEGFPINKETDIDFQIENMRRVMQKILKEDTQSCPSWKRICICILKNDVTWRYAGFAPTYSERVTREECLAMFKNMKKGKLLESFQSDLK